MTYLDAAPWLLAIDTGTSQIVVAAGDLDGTTIAVLGEPAGYRHGELLLATVDRLLAETGLERRGLEGIIVGTGPGAFTGLRVGLATAKTMAHGLGLPIVGIGTALALIRAAARTGTEPTRPDSSIVLLMPAGPRDRLIVTSDVPPRMLVDDGELEKLNPRTVVAVDLEDRAPADAVARGVVAHRGLGASLLILGADRLRAHSVDDPEQLVPEYVTLPRGVTATVGAIEWSNDQR
ncbi:MAG: tRNA (adenosine(37)-N6)-threonylcarbamoyltransferase complex dimerization subunit type 1 TsaB [Chloroflexota bacterium]